ncbi:hypothetical protein ACFVHW_04160 [Streptomyces sp. NPDC127110]|uniref:hypothetical protein n=1 Tax=Streptomyces sp. NPDC127110 TaxID=3345362 RepID=UPI00362A9EE9
MPSRPPFPPDLIQLQAAAIGAYDDLARHPGTASAAALRRRLISLNRAVAAHPYWAQPGHGPADRVALRRTARTHLWGTAA